MLRGAKATSPLMELTPSARYPALQYLDDVDQGGVADLAGLRKGDFLIQVSHPRTFLISAFRYKCPNPLIIVVKSAREIFTWWWWWEGGTLLHFIPTVQI